MINTEYKNEDVLVTHDIREIQGYSGAFCECGATLHIKTPLYAKWCVIECPKCKHIVQLYFGKKRIFEDEMLKDIHMLIGNWFCALED